jgi:hypothetical protein
MAKVSKSAAFATAAETTQTIEIPNEAETTQTIEIPNEPPHNVIPALPAPLPARPINDITQWEAGHLASGWEVEYVAAEGAVRVGTVKLADGGKVEILTTAGNGDRPYLDTTDRSRVLVVLARPQTDWELSVTLSVRQHATTGRSNPASVYNLYSDLQVGQEYGRRWLSMKGGNKALRVLAAMAARVAPPAAPTAQKAV